MQRLQGINHQGCRGHALSSTHRRWYFLYTRWGQAFTKIDPSNAFNHLKVDKSSSEYLTINTTKGMFQPTRLPYGIKTAPLMFQMWWTRYCTAFKGSAVISMTYSLQLPLKQNIFRGWRLYFNELKVMESELSMPNAVSWWVRWIIWVTR